MGDKDRWPSLKWHREGAAMPTLAPQVNERFSHYRPHIESIARSVNAKVDYVGMNAIFAVPKNQEESVLASLDAIYLGSKTTTQPKGSKVVFTVNLG